jgi:hypothetical protein
MRKIAMSLVLGVTLAVSSFAATNNTATKNLTITVNPAPTTLVITTASLPSAFVAIAYSAPLTATGGVGAYTWSVVSGTLPPGMVLDSKTGVISGTTSTTGVYNFTVQVTDSFSTASVAVSATVP